MLKRGVQFFVTPCKHFGKIRRYIVVASYETFGKLSHHCKTKHPEIASTDVAKEAERLFKCKLCDSDFLDKKGLTQHHLSVHEKSKCQHCKQEFGKTNLQRHEKSCVKRIHSKKKKCPLCHKLVANSNTHLKTCKAKTIKERKRVTGSVDSDPQSFLPPTTFCPSG